MKRITFFLGIALALMVAGNVSAGTVKVQTIAAGATAVAAGHAYSPVDVSFGGAVEGYFALQGTIAGSGTAKIEYWTSLDGTTFREPTGATDIISGFTKTSGPASDGKFYVQFFPDFAQYLRIVITETGGVSTITPTVKLLYK
ncbi:MAG: hypothetical protein C4555_05085 [Dehalococcoidia bacterium]|nr:MAG: hypothetical protein C4555_05085 [Dehalococcoidia bacterium]